MIWSIFEDYNVWSLSAMMDFLSYAGKLELELQAFLFNATLRLSTDVKIIFLMFGSHLKAYMKVPRGHNYPIKKMGTKNSFCL